MSGYPKFNTLKKLLNIFDLEDELIIKYDPDFEGSFGPSRSTIRRNYWQQLLPLLTNTNLFGSVNPTKDHWISTGAGITGISFTLSIGGSFARIELAITSSSKEQNKRYFHTLISQRGEIENSFGAPLEWQELPDNKMSRIKSQLDGVSLFESSDWELMNNFFVETLPKFEAAFKSYITKLK